MEFPQTRALLTGLVLLPTALLATLTHSPTRAEYSSVVPNDNRIPAGRLQGDTLAVTLVLGRAEWFPEANGGPHITVEAFSEAGQAPRIPAPLLRVRVGTTIRAAVRNTLSDSTIYVVGLGSHPVLAGDILAVRPGETVVRTFIAGAAGTYSYHAVIGNNPDGRPSERETAVGAFVIDPPEGSPPDRIFVINLIADEAESIPARLAIGINGRSWPYTERIGMAVGDTARWRIVNGTTRGHPMHLHGFYFRVDATGTGLASRVVPDSLRRFGVTEQMQPWTTRYLTWSPNRPGNWLFHCHLTFHVTGEARLHHDEHLLDNHSSDPSRHMAGLVLGIAVRPRPADSYQRTGEPRRLDLFFQQGGRRGPVPVSYSYVLQRGPRPPAPDSLEIPASTIVVTRGTATDIMVHNRAREATGVHWHGLELESWSDGVTGWSARGSAMAPAIQPGDSFRAELTLPRAGTFIYHTHLNDVEQITGGAAGPLIVLEPGDSLDPSRDHIYLTMWNGDQRARVEVPEVLVNGDSVVSAPRELRAGVTHRFRLINIGAAGLIRVSLRRDSSLASWRARAKDGADLPAALRVLQPATQLISVGETYDFELLPSGSGDYELIVMPLAPAGINAIGRPWHQILRVP